VGLAHARSRHYRLEYLAARVRGSHTGRAAGILTRS
jgi:hypothetical protein